jgi:two-component system response regulator AtoC
VRKPYVAVVDDDSAFASYLRTFLSLRGYETRSYSRGDELLAAVKQGDPPDIVLLDVMMPGMNGLETLRALKSAKPELQAIMLSGREQASTIVEAVRLGAADYVVKPDDPEGLGEIALDAAIKSAIEKTRLVSEITELRRQLSDDQDRAFLFWGDTGEMATVAQVIDQVSDSDVTVLIRGESGVGKELVARDIHQRSPRKDRPFVKVNCAALPAELLESELFGHEKGAFTGAASTRIGKFEQADTGTIFLDEIGELRAALQAKLLHVLQDAQFTKLGSNKPITVDVRIVAATNSDLESMMMRGEFREDLYYRLKVIEVTVPPLRERRDEISHLVEFFMDRYARRYNRQPRRLSDALQQLFQSYDWPGNVRELENMIQRIVILQDEQLVVREMARARRAPAFAGAGVLVDARDRAARQQVAAENESDEMDRPRAFGSPVASVAGTDETIRATRTGGLMVGAGGAPAVIMRSPGTLGEAEAANDEGIPEEAAATPSSAATASGSKLADVAKAAATKAERVLIEETLSQVHWNRRRAAEQLGVSYKTLLNKIKECGISRG